MQGHIRRRGKDSWAVVTYAGRDPATGKERHKWHSVKGTKKDAQRELTRLLHQMNTGVYMEPTKITVREFLEQWLRDSVRPSVAASTYDAYELAVRRHLLPGLGSTILSRLQPAAIQSVLRGLLENGRASGRGGLAPASVLKAYETLHRACEQAVKWGWLARNPCKAVDRPRLATRDLQVWDEEKTRLFLEEARRTGRYYPVYLAAIATGMRQAELLGLRWQDVDLLSATASIGQIYYRGAFKQPKTARGRRTVALPTILLEELRRHKARQNEERLLLGPDYYDHGLIFAQPNGKPLHVRNLIRRDFAPLMRRTGVPRIRFHDLRHSHASHLLRAGVHPKVVSERLGHARVGITMDVYSHILPGMQEEAARSVDAFLSPHNHTAPAAPYHNR
jgi:integrase